MDGEPKVSSWDLGTVAQPGRISGAPEVPCSSASSAIGSEESRNHAQVRGSDCDRSTSDPTAEPSGRRAPWRGAADIFPAGLSGGSSRARGQQPAPACSVEGCTADLSLCREYHRRHKVCEVHSKTPVVFVAGQQQRFCQQCSRFHLLGDFDEGKRSCRKRLDGHNRRRRKVPTDPVLSASFGTEGPWLKELFPPASAQELSAPAPRWPPTFMISVDRLQGTHSLPAGEDHTVIHTNPRSDMELSPISASMGAMGSLPGKLGELLATGHWVLRGAMMDEIGELTTDLYILQNLLLNLSNAQNPPMTARYWMKEARELSYDLVDCADQFVRYAHARAKTKTRGSTRRMIITRLKINRLPERRKWLPWITKKVSEFRTRAQEATQRYWRYKFDDCASNPGCSRVGRELPTAYVEVEPGDHVGMEGPMNELDRWLNNGEEQLKVVAIVGAAGIGKTTLAQKLWGKLQGQFECHAFVRTAKKPNMRGIISSILSQVRQHQPLDPGEMHHLIRDLREYLQHKRYLIIIDDLWATSVWDVLSRAFPEGSRCSRIITTTEIMEVAQACCGYCPDYIFQMEFLSDADSHKLLLQRIVSGNQSPQHFDHILPHILRKCAGLPLAITIVSSLLASQPEKLDQLCFVQSSSSLRAHPTIVGFMGQLLNISFDSLPHYLKTCLLYLSKYTEGYIFLKEDLVRQWIAEDFLCAQLGEDMEEVAGSYFDELVNRGLIQLNINHNYELLSYSMHHMVLDFITYKSIEENFITVVDYSQTTILLPDKVRRLSLHFGSATYATIPASTRSSQVRSLFFFGLFNCMPSFVVFKLLRVLNLHLWGDLGNTSFDLTGICELSQLRYLQVTCNVTVKLPDQIEAMEHLETLVINARVCEIPPDIVLLGSLLHLCLQGGANLPDGIGCIRSLRTLKYFDLGDDPEDNLRGLGELTNLRDLHLTYSALPPSEHLKRNLIALASSLGKLCNLKSLTIAPATAGMAVLFDGLSGMSNTPFFPDSLELLPPICIFPRLPEWIGQLRKICVLKVAVRELLTNDIDILTGLPSLEVLSLCVQTAPEGRIIFNEGAFPVLKYFEFRCGVLCLAFMAGAIPNLRRLKLAFKTNIMKSNHMLAGIKHLSNLREITGQIGAATDSDRRAAESAFKEAISKHLMGPRSSIQWVDPVEEEYGPSEKQYVRQEKDSSSEKAWGSKRKQKLQQVG